VLQDNWLPTLKGVKLRGGYTRHCELPETTPVISAFEYVSSVNERMFAANATKLYDVTGATPVLVKGAQTSGNYSATQYSNMGGDFMIAVNDGGDLPLRTKDGLTWIVCTPPGTPGTPLTDGAPAITYPTLPPGVSAQGMGLVYVWKYRNRLFFIQQSSMSAWYLDINAVGGVLTEIPMAGAATRGGKLLFGATWSIDAGDGIDDKCVFVTDLGDVLIFTGSNPGDIANWRQEGRYSIGAPLGMNAHMVLGGDLMIMTVDGIVPLSIAITKDSGNLDLAMITKPIRRLWRDEVALKGAWPWTMKKWDEFGGIFVATPGGTTPETRHCLGINNATGAWCRMTLDATCFLRMRADAFFGTQGGIIMQAERGGTDDGLPYVATLVGGWETFQASSGQVVWHQARAVFVAGFKEPFRPQLSATTDFIVTIPPPLPTPIDTTVPMDVWDEAVWGPPGSENILPVPPLDMDAYGQWDQPGPMTRPIRNTMWVSIGKSGFAHAPIVQIQIAQHAKPDVELIAIHTTQERGGVNV
jgi:hypothetical protein